MEVLKKIGTDISKDTFTVIFTIIRYIGTMEFNNKVKCFDEFYNWCE